MTSLLKIMNHILGSQFQLLFKMKEERIVFPEMGRTEEYQNWLQRILDSGECPFCEEHWPGEHKPSYEIKDLFKNQ